MGRLFEYFAQHSSYESFDMATFLDLQGCLTRYAATNEFKKFVEGIKSSKSSTKQYKDAKRFADKIINEKYQILELPDFTDYWQKKDEANIRRKLRNAQRSQAVQQVNAYVEMLDELGKSEHDESSDDNYSVRESTPSSSSSHNEDDISDTYHYLTHNGSSYHYKLKSDSLRWIVSGSDVSSSFIAYRDGAIQKAEDMEYLNDCEQLALDGIMLIENDFTNTDIVAYGVAQAILKEVDQIDYCQTGRLEKSHQDMLVKFAQDMSVRSIDSVQVQNDIRKFGRDHNADTLCPILTNLVSTYSSDYSSNGVNEATLVRDTIDTFLKAYFPNTPLTKSLGADSMIKDSAKRFLELDPSLTTSGKRADFSVVSTKSQHVILSLEAKSNKTKGVNDLIKLLRELKDTMVSIEEGGRSDVVLCGILMRGSGCDVYAFDHKYDGLYRAILLKTIYMPTSCYDMHRVQSIIPLFQKLALIVESSALVLRNPPSSNRIPDAVPSMYTPTIVRVSKRKLDKKSPDVRQARRKLFK
ncbi:hypothetical protein MBANPS3_011314 [Mucor bainieri]